MAMEIEMSPEVAAAWIGGGCTLLAAAIAFGTLAVQGHQNRKADQRARKQAFNEGLYRDGIAAARAVSNAAGSLMTTLYSTRDAIGVASEAYGIDGTIQAPSTRFPELQALHQAFSEAVTDLVFLIEERRICDRRLEIFKLAFLAKAHDVTMVFHTAILWHMFRALQHELPGGALSGYVPLSSHDFENLSQSINEIGDILGECSAFCDDLIVELQNAHLGDVFEHRVDHRVPLDPSRVVIRLDDYDKLMAWIETTPWEKNNQGIEADFKAKMIEGGVSA